jgi:AcrR family transcriptional regulator
MPTPDARERILATATRLFTLHGVHAVGMQRIIDECGCPLRTTHAEFPEPAHPVHRVATDHFTRVRTQLRELAGATTAPDPRRLADRIMVIIDGLYANGPIFGEAGAESAVAFAEDVVRAETSAEPAKGR